MSQNYECSLPHHHKGRNIPHSTLKRPPEPNLRWPMASKTKTNGGDDRTDSFSHERNMPQVCDSAEKQCTGALTMFMDVV